MTEDDSIYDRETKEEEPSEETGEDDEFDSTEYDPNDLKSRLDHFEKRLMKMEEIMTSLIEQNEVPEEDDDEIDE